MSRILSLFKRNALPFDQQQAPTTSGHRPTTSGHRLATCIQKEEKSTQQMVIEVGLNRLLNGKYFSVCIVREIGEVLGVDVYDSPLCPQLRLLHCVDYCDMPPELVKRIPQMVLDILTPRQKPVDTDAIARALFNDSIDGEVL